LPGHAMPNAAQRKRLEELREIQRKRLAAAKAEADKRRSLSEQFTEARILRLFAIKPTKITDLKQARSALGSIKLFRSFVADSSKFSTVQGCKRGWNEFPRSETSGKFDTYRVYLATTTRIAKLDVLIEDLEERVVELKAEDRLESEARKRSRQAVKHFVQAGQDEKLAGALWHALDNTPPTTGFIYLKRWTMPDGSCWYKVGISNNPDRRETEQNVLPVAAESIVCVDVGSMDRARAIEAVIHQVLDEQRIKDANNRELFHLSIHQASAVKAVLERLA
jgi:hypothetical protein